MKTMGTKMPASPYLKREREREKDRNEKGYTPDALKFNFKREDRSKRREPNSYFSYLIPSIPHYTHSIYLSLYLSTIPHTCTT
jgi:hypothetical protein